MTDDRFTPIKKAFKLVDGSVALFSSVGGDFVPPEGAVEVPYEVGEYLHADAREQAEAAGDEALELVLSEAERSQDEGITALASALGVSEDIVRSALGA